IAGHVHRVTSISRLPRENPKPLRTPAEETAESIRRAERAKPYSRSRLACTRGIALMEFRNERTWQNAADLGKTEDFHLNYEAAGLLRWYATEMIRNQGYEHTMGQFLPGESARAMLKPYGVWAVVAPFNFPFAIAAGMSTGALIAGNTVVFKPASDTPYIGLKLCELLHEAGLPPGVFNYVTGPGATVGQELVDN